MYTKFVLAVLYNKVVYTKIVPNVYKVVPKPY